MVAVLLNQVQDKIIHFLCRCRLRKTTWQRLLYFSGGTLTELLDQLTKRDALYPLLTPEQYKGIERRMLMLFAAAEMCFDRYGKETVLV